MSRLVLLFAAAAAACLAVVVTVDALPNGVGFTPAMGYVGVFTLISLLLVLADSLLVNTLCLSPPLSSFAFFVSGSYNTWNDFRCDGITADNVKKVAKKMVDLGLNQIGYEYVNIGTYSTWWKAKYASFCPRHRRRCHCCLCHCRTHSCLCHIPLLPPVVLDDCWAVGRENGTNIIIANTTAFPKGIKDVADYVHGLGLKFGIYTDRGKARGACWFMAAM